MYDRPFHWWVQSVMPLVFDDSLSYYEVLAKLTKYIDGLKGDVDQIEKILETIEGIEDVTQFTEFLESIQAQIGNLENLQTQTKASLVSAINEVALKADIAYWKPPTGIPESDLSQEVKDKLNRVVDATEYIINNRKLKTAPNNNSPSDLGLGTYTVPDGGIPWETLSDDVKNRINQGSSGGTTDYTALNNKPQINGHTLNAGNNTAESLGIGTYSMPNGGIPESDLSAEVQEKLNTSGGIADSESNFVATRDYTAGELVYINGQLYRIKYDILNGTNLIPGNNIEATDINEELEKINSDIEALQSGSGPDSWNLTATVQSFSHLEKVDFFEYFNCIGGENYKFIVEPVNPSTAMPYILEIRKRDGTVVLTQSVTSSTDYMNRKRFTFVPENSGEYYCTLYRNASGYSDDLSPLKVTIEYTQSQGISELWNKANAAAQLEPRVGALETLVGQQQEQISGLNGIPERVDNVEADADSLNNNVELLNNAVYGDVDDTFPLTFIPGTYRQTNIGNTLEVFHNTNYDKTRRVIETTVFNAPCNVRLTAKEGFCFTIYSSNEGVITGSSGLITSFIMTGGSQYGAILRAEDGSDISALDVTQIVEIEYEGIAETLLNSVELNNDILALNDSIVLPYSADNIGKGIRFSTGEYISNSYLCTTNYIDVTLFGKLKYKSIETTAETPVYGMAFYDKDKVFISGQRAYAYRTQFRYAEELREIDVPDNAIFARFSMFNNTETYGNFEVYGVSKIVTKFPVKSPFEKNIIFGNYSSDWYEAQGDNYEGFNADTLYSEMITAWDALMGNSKGYITKETIGTSSDNQTMYCYKMIPLRYRNATGNAIVNNAPTFLIIASIHGYEKSAAYGMYYFARDLVLNFDKNPVLNSIRTKCALYVIPVANPYGFDNKVRKNANSVDLNRNWGVDPGGETDPTSPEYPGAEPFDQPETQAIKTLIDNNPNLFYLVDYHTNGQYKVTSWANVNWITFGYSVIEDPYRKYGYIASQLQIAEISENLPIEYNLNTNGESIGSLTLGAAGAPSRPTVTAYVIKERDIMGVTMEGNNGIPSEEVSFSPTEQKINSELIGNYLKNLLLAFRDVT